MTEWQSEVYERQPPEDLTHIRKDRGQYVAL